MKRILKIFGITLAVLLLLILIALLLVKLFFDPNDFRDEISEQVRAATGRDFTIAGDLSLSVFPRVAVEINDVTLGNAPGFDDEFFARIETAGVGVEFMPLLSKEIVVGKVRLSGLHLNLQVNASGTDNWSDLGVAESTEEETPDTVEDSDGSTFTAREIGGLDLANASVNYRDDQTNTRYQVRDVNLQIGALEAGVPFDMNGGLRLIQGDNELIVDVSVATMADLDLNAGRYRLIGPGIDLAVSGTSVGETPVDVRIEAQTLAADLGAETATLEAMEVAVHDVTLRGNLAGVKLLGQSQFSGSLVVDEFSPKEFLTKLGSAPPDTADVNALTRVSLQATITATANTAELNDLKVRMDDTTVTGSLSIVDIAREAMRFDLRADEINLDRYLPLESEESPKESTAETAPPVAVPTEAIRNANLQGKIAVGTAYFADMRFTDLEFGIIVADGQARLHPSRADFYGGTYSGDIQLDVNPTPPRMSMNETVSGIRIEDMSRDLYGDVLLSGVAGGSVNMTAVGTNTAQLSRSVNGNLDFDIVDGAIEGIDIWHEVLVATAALRGEPAPEGPGRGRTPFTELGGNATVADGVLNNDKLVVALEYLRINGSGTVNLADTTMDYRTEARILDIPDVAVDDSLREVCDPIAVRITGTLSEPSPRPDIAACAMQRVENELNKQKEALKEKEDELKEEVEEKLKDKLKDIFGK